MTLGPRSEPSGTSGHTGSSGDSDPSGGAGASGRSGRSGPSMSDRSLVRDTARRLAAAIDADLVRGADHAAQHVPANVNKAVWAFTRSLRARYDDFDEARPSVRRLADALPLVEWEQLMPPSATITRDSLSGMVMDMWDRVQHPEGQGALDLAFETAKTMPDPPGIDVSQYDARTRQLIRVAVVLQEKALANPNPLETPPHAIFLACGPVAAALGVSHTTVSVVLKLLVRDGVLKSEIVGGRKRGRRARASTFTVPSVTNPSWAGNENDTVF